MANHAGDDLFDQILGFPPLTGNESSSSPAMLQLNSGQFGGSGSGFEFPLGLSLEQDHRGGGYMNVEDASGSVKRFSDHAADTRISSSSIKSSFRAQSMQNPLPAMPHSSAIHRKGRAKRGHATDPHSIAERLRRERIAERIRALQELVPSIHKTDRATMLDEIVDYVKFLRLQVKAGRHPEGSGCSVAGLLMNETKMVLSMSRLGGAAAVAPLVTDIPISSIEEDGGEDQRNQAPWEKSSNDGTERQVAKLVEENVGAAMQLLQSKALCIMPISLASAIYHTQPPDSTTLVNPKIDHPS